MEILTDENFTKAVRKAGRYIHRICPRCKYQIGWVVKGPYLYYDPGCDCTGKKTLRLQTTMDFWFNPAHGEAEKIERFIREHS